MSEHIKTYTEHVGDSKIPRKFRKALDAFFSRHPELAEGCVLRSPWDGAPIALIIESSTLYDHLQGEYGWDVHTDFHNAFKGTGYFPEMMNSCTVGFYKD